MNYHVRGEKLMSATTSQSTAILGKVSHMRIPKPGEIWELSRDVQSPILFSEQQQYTLYSNQARRFLKGESPPRYVMIVTEPEPLADTQEKWQEVAVMVLSGEIHFLSYVDLLIPKEVSGIGQDLLAETWHVLPMLSCNLLKPVGERLSKKIYDVLMALGDYYYGLINQVPSEQEIQTLGLQVSNFPVNSAFHFQEQAWSDVLSVPLAAHRVYLKGIQLVDELLNDALQLERELQRRIPLNQWWHNTFNKEWMQFSDFFNSQAPSLAVASRTAEDCPDNQASSQEIAELIHQLSIAQNEQERRRAAKRLGDIAQGNDNAIQALITLLQTTEDDETLWTAVESLWQIDPGNPASGVRRVRLIDLGMQVAGQTVALAVALMQKSNGQVGVLLRVYPTGNESYLPPDLKLILLDDSSKILREVTARRADIYIQLKLNGQPGECFGVRVTLREASITEDFVI